MSLPPLPAPAARCPQAALKQQVQDKEETARKSQQLVAGLEAEKRARDEAAAVYTASNARLKGQLEASIKEIEKGNAIISKLQNDKRDARSKLKLKLAVVREQERLLQQKDAAADAAKRREDVLETEGRRLAAEVEGLSGRRAESEKRLAEAKEILAKNQQVIGWLNKELNESKMQRKRSIAATANASAAYTYRPSFTIPDSSPLSARIASHLPIAGGGKAPGKAHSELGGATIFT